MTQPTETELEALRDGGMRPTVVACCCFQGKLLIVYAKRQRSWSLVQGGIEVGETLEAALHRELNEECGSDSFIDWSRTPELISVAQVQLHSKQSRKRTYQIANGETRHMRGKTYFFVALQALTDILELEKSEFDKMRWAKLESAQGFAAKLEPPERAAAYQEVLKLLADQGFLKQTAKNTIQ